MSDTTLNDLEDKALIAELVVSQHKLVRFRFAHSMNRLDNTASLRDLRRGIAKLKTEIRRREIAAGLPKEALVAQYAGEAEVTTDAEEAASSGGFLKGVVDKISG